MRNLITLGMILALATVLVGCSKQQPLSEAVPAITNNEECSHCYKEAGDLVRPYMRLSDNQAKPGNGSKAQADLRRGIALYSAVVAYAPTNWAAYWLMGKTYQALRDPTNACDAFGKSFSLQKEKADVAREYMFECLELGRTGEGVMVAEHALSLKPQDAGLLANLALAYTIAGRIPEASAAVEKSLSLNPADEITLNLKRVIREISDGKRPQPKTLGELSRG